VSALPKCQIPKRLQPWAERSKEWIKTPCGWLGCALVAVLIAWAAKPVGKDWVDVLRALATPAIAYAGYSIASRGLQIQRQKRKDDLFDKRYEFFEIFRKSFIKRLFIDLEISRESLQNPSNETDWTFFFYKYASEAEFLFGEKCRRKIEKMDSDKCCEKDDNDDFYINDSFKEPFIPYLRLDQ
jgi:hypothetical protein